MVASWDPSWHPSPLSSSLPTGLRDMPRTHISGQEDDLCVGPAFQHPEAVPIVPEQLPMGLATHCQGHSQGHGLLAGLCGCEARGLGRRWTRHGLTLVTASRMGCKKTGVQGGLGDILAKIRGPESVPTSSTAHPSSSWAPDTDLLGDREVCPGLPSLAPCILPHLHALLSPLGPTGLSTPPPRCPAQVPAEAQCTQPAGGR